MDYIKGMLEAISQMENQSLLLLFSALWVLGFLLKEHTSLNNNLIPWVLTVSGVGLGLFIIEVSVYGAVAGAVIAYVIMAFYEKIKGTIALFGQSSK